MGVKAGYRQTEVGDIPKQWAVKALGEIANLYQPTTISANLFTEDGYPVYGANGVVGQFHSFNHDSWQVTVTCRGSTCGTVNRTVEKCWITGNAMVINADQSRDVDKAFLYFLLLGTDLTRCITGTGQPQIVRAPLSAIRLAIPPPPEQRAIAEALSDVDALLSGLDRLIAKKRDLKQAAMQQLLTGQTRLPGFHGEWEVKRVPEIVEIRSGGTPSTLNANFWDGEISWCTPTDITALEGRKYLRETSRTITREGLMASSAELIPARCIVMTTRATIGECAINEMPMSTNQGFKNFVPFEKIDVEFLYYLLLTQKSRFISLCSGSTFLEIGKAQLSAYSVTVPPTKSEQTAIAQVLSDMDAELAVLEARREKTRQLKQGMMQELLTGRTRLV